MFIKKKDLTTRHVIKNRAGDICFLAEMFGRNDLYLFKSRTRVVSHLNLFNDDLDPQNDIMGVEENSPYDIMAITEFSNTQEALLAVIDEDKFNWQWER